ncbi:MAG: response regulator transcription factor [Patescibacteria group bacterium]|nr:response regulator transcription factor [Patescibacteria group bacterium]
MKNLLLVENDSPLAHSICQSLAQPDISIYTVASLSAAYDLLEKMPFRLAIIDRILDDGDGMELVEYLTQDAPDISVLVISQKSAQIERIKGMRAGAIDYLTKPLEIEELRLKIKKLLRLRLQNPTNVIKLGQLNLDLNSGILTFGAESKQLRKRETELLTCLMAHPNQVMSRDQLITHVWGSLSDQPLYSTLDVYIRRIRIKLGAISSTLKTIRGFGYMLKTNSVH